MIIGSAVMAADWQEEERILKMKSDDIGILQDVQKNTKMAMKAIDALSGKIYDDTLSVQMARESMKYAEIYNKATDRLLSGKAAFYRDNGFQDMMLKGSVNMNTMLNTSTSHIAEMLIQGSNRGLTSMWKSVNHHEKAGDMSMEIAKELMDFEEKNIERLKQYL